MEKTKTHEYCVYKHTSPSGKVYIGITSRSPEARWRNGKGYYNCYFYRAINKYGWDNIVHEVLFTGLPKDEAVSMEASLIEQYGSNTNERGYNVSPGGYVQSDFGRKQIAEKAKLRWLDNDFREKQTKIIRSACNTEQELTRRKERMTALWTDESFRIKTINNMKAAFTSEGKERARIRLKKLWGTDQYRKKMAEILKHNWEQNEFREMIAEKRRTLWKNEEFRVKTVRAIREACKSPERSKKISDAKKSQWANPDNKRKWSAAIRKAKARPVKCLETNTVYCSTSEARKALCIKSDHLAECCEGRRKTSGGYHWEWADKEALNDKQS